MMTIREKTTLQARVLQSLMETVKAQLTDDSQGGEWLISADKTEYEITAGLDEGGDLVITATLTDDDGEICREVRFTVNLSLTPGPIDEHEPPFSIHED
jgi:hypothetical protein